MSKTITQKNYTTKYITLTYIAFWLGVLIIGGLFLLTNASWLTDFATIPLSWIPTIVLLVMFNKLIPNSTRKQWVKKSFSAKVNIRIVLFSALAFILSIVLTYLIMLCYNSDVTKITFNSSTIITILSAFVMSAITGATGEELGWRGYLQNYYETQYGGNVIKASLKVGLVWTLWHIPLWLTSTADQSVWFMLNHIITFSIQCMSLAIIIAICYKHCRNIFIPMWIHFLSNFTMAIVSPYFTTSTAIMNGKCWLALFYSIIAFMCILWHRKQLIQNKQNTQA